MSTLQATNLKHGSSASNNLVLDANGNVTAAGTVAMATPFSMRNKIINGAMEIDQRNAGASVTVNTTGGVYTLDRWYGRGVTSAGVFTVQQSSIAPTGFRNSVLCTVTTSSSPSASDLYFIQQRIEGFNTVDLSFGTAAAKTVTLSFWVRSSLTGSFGGSIGNNVDQSYPFSYSINATNTWEYKTVTIPGSTTGTWNTTNGTGLIVHFSLGTGSSGTGTANVWGNYPYAPTGSVNVIATNGATFYLTGVQLEVGSVATPFERRPYGLELSLCSRFYQLASLNYWLYGVGGVDYSVPVTFNTVMRAAPTAVRISGTAFNLTSEVGAESITAQGLRYTAKWSNSAAGGFVGGLVACSAEL